MTRALEVLVIDDDPVFGDGLQEMLAAVGLRVRVQRRTQDAVLELVSGKIPDLVLIKLEQQDMPTRAACLGMRGTPGMRRTPLVVYSAKPAPLVAAEVKQCGAHGMLSVPFTAQHLQAWIEANRDYFPPEVTLPAAGPALSPRQVSTALDADLDPEQWVGEDLTPAPPSTIGAGPDSGAASSPPGSRGTASDTSPESRRMSRPDPEEISAIEEAIWAAATEEISEIQAAQGGVAAEVTAAAHAVEAAAREASRAPARPIPPALAAALPGVAAMPAPLRPAVPIATMDPTIPVPVLLVDDEELVLEMLTDMLENDGYTLYRARGDAEFRDIISRVAFGAIVLDVNLGGDGSGDRIASYVQSFVEPPRPRIYLHSALAERELKRMAINLGCAGYLPKGCGSDVVRLAVHEGVDAFAREWQLLVEAGM